MNSILVLVLLQLANYCPIELAQAETFPLHPQKDSALRGRGTKGQEGHSLIEIQTLMCHRQTADQNSQLKGEQNGANYKVIDPKYYKHLKKGAHQSRPFGQTKNGLVSVRLACTSSKTEILNKIGIQILILNLQLIQNVFSPKKLEK